MKANYLLPNKYKTLGWILFIAGIASGILLYANEYETDTLTINVFSIYSGETILGKNGAFFQIIKNSIVDELTTLAIIIGGLIVSFYQ